MHIHQNQKQNQFEFPCRINFKCSVRTDQFCKIRDGDISIWFQSMKVRKGLNDEETLRKINPNYIFTNHD